jgi:hypothetical protein
MRTETRSKAIINKSFDDLGDHQITGHQLYQQTLLIGMRQFHQKLVQ